jgi:hypothetical protein
VYFPRVGGQAEWEFDGEIQRASFDEDVSPEDAARRLQTFLHPTKSDYIRNTFARADSELSGIRADGQDRAGGLIIAKDVDHANRIADDIVTPVLRKRPAVVTSDRPEATTTIRNFTNSTDRWLIAVRMVSEGVDIPRLRILLYATNIRTRLFFQQAVGRVIRGPQAHAQVYIPADPELLRFAGEIKDMRSEALRTLQESIDDDGDIIRPVLERTPLVALHGFAHNDGVIHSAGGVTQSELDQTRQLLEVHGAPDQTVPVVTAVARLLRDADRFEVVAPSASPAAAAEPTISQRKKDLRDAQNAIVTAYGFRTANGDQTAVRDIIRACNADLNRAVGIRRLRDATEEQLRSRLVLARDRYGI